MLVTRQRCQRSGYASSTTRWTSSLRVLSGRVGIGEEVERGQATVITKAGDLVEWGFWYNQHRQKAGML